jgi:Tfp pilus assembly protein PilF
MHISSSRFHRLLLCSTAILLGTMGASSSALAAFDPNAGATPPGASSDLPDPSILYDSGAARAPAQPRPLYPSLMAPGAAVPIPPVMAQQPANPSYPAAAPALGASAQPGFIAPAPVFAIAPPSAGMASAPVTPTYSPVASDEELSPQTKTILSHIPSKLDTIHPTVGKPIAVSRVSPEVNDVLGKDAKVTAYDSVGISIKVRRPGLDANYELNRAYVALMGGDTDNAIQIYKNILSTDPVNQDALFGLATTYHRLGEIEKARPLYGMLLKINPNHREGLNNFLALVSDESPQEALAELERLEQRNPDFSPIPAQEAVVLSKMGYADRAREKMLRAIDLSPDNLTYKYNLAVMLDTHGDYADAGALYRLLIKASTEGQTVPSSVDEMQKRLNYITTAAAESRPTTGG